MCMGVSEHVWGCVCVGVYGWMWVCMCVGVYVGMCGCVCGWMGVGGCIFVWVWVCMSVGVLRGGLAGWDGLGFEPNAFLSRISRSTAELSKHIKGTKERRLLGQNKLQN